MQRLRLSVLACIVVFGGLAGCGVAQTGQAESQGTTSSAQPKLLVVVVVDQMRFDYIPRMEARWTQGFRRLLTEGAVFTEARYPYLNTVTCVGHATIGTGAYPRTHGVFLNEWWDRTTEARVPCTADASVTNIPYEGEPEARGHSAQRLRVPTLGDRLREASPGSRVVTLSVKPRSAIMLAGHGGYAVTWLDPRGHWSTSSAFSPAPVPEIAAYVDAHPVDRDRTATWTLLEEPARYTGADEVPSERPKEGWTTEFPHPLAGAPGAHGARFHELWTRSPYSDDYVGRMAASLVERFALGQRGTTDLLAVSFSGLDYVGHDFGPASYEAQDTLLRLDRTLGAFFDALDAHVGRGRWTLALSADHGAAPIPESVPAGGRLLPGAVKAAAEAALAGIGDGPNVADVNYTNLFLTASGREALAASPDALERMLDALRTLPGVRTVFRSADLEGATASSDPLRRAAALSYVPGLSGDVVIVPREGWIMSTAGTTHGTLNDYDQHVPVIFLGSAFEPGRYPDAASPADIAPTLASLIGLPLPTAAGRSLVRVGTSTHP